MFRPPNSLTTQAATLIGVLMLAGCLPPQAEFSPGLSTRRISGFFEPFKSKSPQGPPLIVVYKFHRSFASGPGQENILLPTAHVVQVARGGAFSITIPWDVVAANVFFIAPGRLTESFQFKKTLGVGAITYRPNLKRMPAWRNHFYTFLNPQLQHLIVEKRYRLTPGDLRTLSQWLNFQNNRLTGPGAANPAKNSIPSPEPDGRSGTVEKQPSGAPAKL